MMRVATGFAHAGESDVDILQMPLDPHGSRLKWSHFTRMPIKAELYRQEAYFREGLSDAVEILANKFPDRLRQAAVLMVKPEGLAGGKARTILDFVRSHGFRVLAVAAQTLTRLQWRELWRYQLSAATIDRIEVNDLIVRDEILLTLLYRPEPLDVPASVWLSAQKGPSDTKLQPRNCLRHLLAQPNRLFSCFHTSDEPADLLRELAILLDGPARRRFLTQLSETAIPAAEQQLLEETIAASDRSARVFDAAHALHRLEQAVRTTRGAPADRIRADIERMHRGERLEWRTFAQAVAAAGIQLERWDLAILGATYITHDQPGMSKMIATAGLDLWRTN